MEGTYEITGESWQGPELEGIRYEQLIPWVKPMGDAFRVIVGDYVTTSDGTGIVHIAPTFGADDDRVGRAAGIAPLFMVDKAGKNQPMVDRQGKFFLLEEMCIRDSCGGSSSSSSTRGCSTRATPSSPVSYTHLGRNADRGISPRRFCGGGLIGGILQIFKSFLYLCELSENE